MKIVKEITLIPADIYMVTKLLDPSNVCYDVLTLLYQPIIGTEAYSLLMMLWAEEERTPNNHSIFLNSLNTDLVSFENSRSALEGIGLVKTFESSQSDYHSFIYQLQVPLTAMQFFEDDILSTLLLDIVGIERYKQLVRLFSIKQEIPSNYREITSNFNDSYQVYDFLLEQDQQLKQDAKQQVVTAKAQGPTLVQTTNSNFEVFLRSLNPRIVDLESVRNLQSFIETMQKMYNLDFNELKTLIQQSADLQTGIVNKDDLQKQIVLYTKPTNPEHQVGKEEIQDWRKLGFDAKTIEVFQSATSLGAQDFLDILKKEKGGQRTEAEYYLIRNSVTNGTLPASVINIVSYYLLIIKGYAELPKFFEILLNRLGLQHIYEVSKAWELLPSLFSELTNTKTGKKEVVNRNYRSKKKVIQSEWDQPQIAKKTSVSTEDLEILRQRIDKL